MRLEGKVAVVTGAASGFGEGIARRFVAEGAKVVVADIAIDGGANAWRRRSATAGIACHADVSRDANVAAMLAAALERSAASTSSSTTPARRIATGRCSKSREAEFDRVYAVNVKSIFLSAKHFVPHFRAHGGGVFVNIASTAGVRPRPASPGTTAARARSSRRAARWRPNSAPTTSASTASTR